ncbi:ATP-dependent zinc protease [Luteolibacter pohnpeiensis]|uniref:ATP-dependent zinc protease n=1 Tax=Luteolibacter pohnpeiensis TaxID=454153 RepID=A0A934S853_9BACT|nr:ATP-dependent zinc protease [Luteolibacter pohnpeiensis]MBK1882989.1 ATP-dependent zinc protease [Luteolibacter pohnpeiensis]
MITHSSPLALRRIASILLAVFLFPNTLLNAAEPEKAPATAEKSETQPEKKETAKKPETPVAPEDESAKKPDAAVDQDDEMAVEDAEAKTTAVARPVSPDLVQVYGWREHIQIDGISDTLQAKLDTGAHTSSIHAEQKELFERDGKKWVRFVVTDPRVKDSPRTQVEAPLVRIARIKEPGGESVPREVVRLTFKIGDRKLRADFTLNNRKNMLSPVLIGRITIKELGWIDPSRTYLADKKVMR